MMISKILRQFIIGIQQRGIDKMSREKVEVYLFQDVYNALLEKLERDKDKVYSNNYESISEYLSDFLNCYFDTKKEE